MVWVLFIFVINSIAFFTYCNDKHRAVYGKWRIPEFVLLVLAFAGGAFGAWISMLLFRHKTDKPLFKYGVPLMLVIQCVIFYFMGYPLNILPDISL